MKKIFEVVYRELRDFKIFEERYNEYYEKETKVTEILSKLKRSLDEHYKTLKKKENLMKKIEKKNLPKRVSKYVEDAEDLEDYEEELLLYEERIRLVFRKITYKKKDLPPKNFTVFVHDFFWMGSKCLVLKLVDEQQNPRLFSANSQLMLQKANASIRLNLNAIMGSIDYASQEYRLFFFLRLKEKYNSLFNLFLIKNKIFFFFLNIYYHFQKKKK